MTKRASHKSNATRKVTERQVTHVSGSQGKRGRLGNPWYTSKAKSGPVTTYIDKSIISSR